MKEIWYQIYRATLELNFLVPNNNVGHQSFDEVEDRVIFKGFCDKYDDPINKVYSNACEISVVTYVVRSTLKIEMENKKHLI